MDPPGSGVCRTVGAGWLHMCGARNGGRARGARERALARGRGRDTGATVTSGASTKGTSNGGAAALGFTASISGDRAGGGSSTERGTSTRPRSIHTRTPTFPRRSSLRRQRSPRLSTGTTARARKRTTHTSRRVRKAGSRWSPHRRCPARARIRAHLLRWRPRPHAQRTESTPRVRSSGAASQLDPSPRSSRVCPMGSRLGA